MDYPTDVTFQVGDATARLFEELDEDGEGADVFEVSQRRLLDASVTDALAAIAERRIPDGTDLSNERLAIRRVAPAAQILLVEAIIQH